MGLRRIDEQPKMSISEWEEREMRRHIRKRILITLGEIIIMAGFLWLFFWLSDSIHP